MKLMKYIRKYINDEVNKMFRNFISNLRDGNNFLGPTIFSILIGKRANWLICYFHQYYLNYKVCLRTRIVDMYVCCCIRSSTFILNDQIFLLSCDFKVVSCNQSNNYLKILSLNNLGKCQNSVSINLKNFSISFETVNKLYLLKDVCFATVCNFFTTYYFHSIFECLRDTSKWNLRIKLVHLERIDRGFHHLQLFSEKISVQHQICRELNYNLHKLCILNIDNVEDEKLKD